MDFDVSHYIGDSSDDNEVWSLFELLTKVHVSK